MNRLRNSIAVCRDSSTYFLNVVEDVSLRGRDPGTAMEEPSVDDQRNTPMSISAS